MQLVNSLRFTAATVAGLTLMGAASGQSGDKQKSALEANFHTADENGDGALDRDEFETFVNANAESDLGRAKQIRRFNAYGRAFSKLDSNGDASVTRSEIQTAQSGD